MRKSRNSKLHGVSLFEQSALFAQPLDIGFLDNAKHNVSFVLANQQQQQKPENESSQQQLKPATTTHQEEEQKEQKEKQELEVLQHKQQESALSLQQQQQEEQKKQKEKQELKVLQPPTEHKQQKSESSQQQQLETKQTQKDHNTKQEREALQLQTEHKQKEQYASVKENSVSFWVCVVFTEFDDHVHFRTYMNNVNRHVRVLNTVDGLLLGYYSRNNRQKALEAEYAAVNIQSQKSCSVPYEMTVEDALSVCGNDTIFLVSNNSELWCTHIPVLQDDNVFCNFVRTYSTMLLDHNNNNKSKPHLLDASSQQQQKHIIAAPKSSLIPLHLDVHNKPASLERIIKHLCVSYVNQQDKNNNNNNKQENNNQDTTCATDAEVKEVIKEIFTKRVDYDNAFTWSILLNKPMTLKRVTGDQKEKDYQVVELSFEHALQLFTNRHNVPSKEMANLPRFLCSGFRYKSRVVSGLWLLFHLCLQDVVAL